jgi:aspartyl-tRNA(Asn)/glutamyl-tRNA(Gln) amidotransferase subunit C
MDVEKIAELARIELNDEEKKKFSIQFNTIIKWIDELNEVNTESVEPIYSVTEATNNFRKDEPIEFENAKDIIKNFPNREYDFLKVKKVIG